MENQLISIVLPIYNQEKFITPIIESYEEALSKIPQRHELLLVINGCRDNSLEVCQELAERYDAIRVLESATAGWGGAVKCGINDSKGDFICYTNSARTKAKDLILFLLYSIANPDVVIKANRKIRDNFIRRFGSLLYNIECRALYDLASWDVNGTPKVFPRKFTKLFHLTRDDDLIDLEFNYIVKINDYPMLEIPTFFPERHGGKSTTGYASALNMYLKALQLRRAFNHQKE